MTPYTYLIGWKDQEKYYYGVRFSKKCHPKELWVKYFTSSKYVKEAIKNYGAPDIVQIRKTFDDANKARRWEEKVLKRLGVVDRSDFINKTDNISISAECSSQKGKKWINNGTEERLVEKIISGWNYGRLSHGRSPSERFIHNKPHSEETKRLISLKKTGRTINRSGIDLSGKRNPMYGRMWVTNGITNKTINKTESIPEGYWKGKMQNGR